MCTVVILNCASLLMNVSYAWIHVQHCVQMNIDDATSEVAALITSTAVRGAVCRVLKGT